MVAPWRLCQQCCCRYGCFPLLVVPIVTLGCCLSLYSSAGCKFVDIEIGFQPTNEGWEASTPYSFGPLFYHNKSMEHDSMYRETLHTGCVSFSDSFFQSFIEGDRTFKMIQIMTLISCVASVLAMFVSWIFVISPIPAGILWPAVLLPSIMIAFISEGSKFLIFDTALCRSQMWYRGSLLVAEKAESCTMGDTAWFAIAATVLHFWALVCVCLRAPERRTFHKNAGPIDDTKEEQEEKTGYDDPDLETGDDNSVADSFLKIEKDESNSLLNSINNILKSGTMENDCDIKEISVTKGSFLNNECVSSAPKCKSRDLSLTLEAIETISKEVECCSPMSEGMHLESPELAIVPDIPTRGNNALSPVDCIIEGFDVATDLSQIDVCRTMMYSPTYKALMEDAAAAAASKTETVQPAEGQSSGLDKVPEPTPGTLILDLAKDSTISPVQSAVQLEDQSPKGVSEKEIPRSGS